MVEKPMVSRPPVRSTTSRRPSHRHFRHDGMRYAYEASTNRDHFGVREGCDVREGDHRGGVDGTLWFASEQNKEKGSERVRVVA